MHSISWCYASRAMLNDFALTDDDPHRFDELIMQVNEFISYFRQHVVPKKDQTN